MTDGSEQPEDLPLGFDIIMRSEIWPHGEGPVHNYEDPCSSAPDSGARTDLHTVPGDGKRLCRYCEWPSNAEQALNFDDSLRAGGGQPASGSDRPGWVCTGCGKHVSGTIPVDVCADCGGEWVEATPDRLACEGCGAEDASRVLNSQHNRLCEGCIRRENSIPVDALEELRKEWEQAARGSTSGRALGLETAADELRVLVEEHKGLPEEDDGPEIRADGSGEPEKERSRFPFEEGDTVLVRAREAGTAGNIVAKFEATCERISESGVGTSPKARFEMPFGTMNSVSIRPYEAEFEVIDDE